ncbi:amino acid ABC transporter permease [Halomarina ordinaria]|uniref:Amino acid ABC transporter permease n=1 Tax=Halomarina ordinaria TaxID=3033939 RepID=A0ABD5UAX5_9EURY|nr:amino acid ABC transporter permease [Halomarina sp. PSRA2]
MDPTQWTLALSPGLQTSPGDWAFVWDNAGYLAKGIVITVLLTATSMVLGFLAGFPAGAIEVYGRGPLRSAVRGAGVVLRGTPILVILFLLFFVSPLPLPEGDVTIPLLDDSLSFGMGAFLTATLGLGLRSAAYQSQIFRGALQSVSEGQMEAARSVGLSKVAALRYVVVPQALRRSIPGFQNEFTIVLKDTSIAFAIGLAELFARSDNLTTQQSTATLELFLAISLVYFVLTFATNRSLDYLGRYYAIPGGNS